MKYNSCCFKHIILMVIVSITILLLPSVYAVQEVLGTFVLDQPVNLVQTCDNCTSVNITSIIYPNGYINDTLLQMTHSGTFFNYTLSNTSIVGQYIYNTCGDLNGIVTCQPVNFFINQAGYDLSIAQSLLYFIALIIVTFLFLLSLYFSIVIPYSNIHDEITGKFIGVNKLKYLKLILMAVSYMLLLLLVGITNGILNSFLYVRGISQIFNWLYWLMLSAIFPIIVVTFIAIIGSLVNDHWLEKVKSRGGYYR